MAATTNKQNREPTKSIPQGDKRGFSQVVSAPVDQKVGDGPPWPHIGDVSNESNVMSIILPRTIFAVS